MEEVKSSALSVDQFGCDRKENRNESRNDTLNADKGSGLTVDRLNGGGSTLSVHQSEHKGDGTDDVNHYIDELMRLQEEEPELDDLENLLNDELVELESLSS